MSTCVCLHTYTFFRLQRKGGSTPHRDLQVGHPRLVLADDSSDSPTVRVTDLFPIKCSLGKFFCHSKCWDLAHLICWESKVLLQLFTRAKIWKEGRVRTKSADKGLWNDCSELLRFCVVYYSPKTWSSYEIKSYGTDKNGPVRVVCGPNCRPPNSPHFRNLKRLKRDKVVSQRKNERETKREKQRERRKEKGRK